MLKNYWKNFLAESGRSEDTQYAWSICFGMDKAGADSAAEGVLRGEKRAMIYPEQGYRANMNRPVQRGDFIIVCDWQETPRAVVQVEKVERVSLDQISEEHAAADAGAASLEAWREACLPAIKTEIEELGGEFRDDAPLTCVFFKKVYPGA